MSCKLIDDTFQCLIDSHKSHKISEQIPKGSEMQVNSKE